MDHLPASRSPRPAARERARQLLISPSACTICRARKVKCDKIIPSCTGCSNHPDECRYEQRRKRISSRSTYKDMATRLAKMESIVKATAGGKALTPPSNQFFEFDSRPDPKIPPNTPGTSLGPSSELIFEVEELTSVSKTALLRNDLPDQAVLGPHVPHSTSSPVDNDLNVEYTGSFCFFSPEGVQWVNKLVGDDSFARAVSTLKLPIPLANSGIEGISPIHPLPNKQTTIECAKDYLAGLNCVLHLFDGQDIMNGIEMYYSTGKVPSQTWFTAINVIMAHALRERSDRESSMQCEKYIGNAMSMIPSILMSEPNLLNAGAMLSMTVYFAFVPRSQTAIMILGAAIQLMILGGYHTTKRRSGQADVEKNRQRRLFWQAFVLDQDLALHVGKPPIMGLDLITDLPHDLPADGVDLVTFANGTTLYMLREQVRLARIKSKVYSLLYANDTCTRRAHEDVKIIFDLDSELCAWKANIPDINKYDGPETGKKDHGLICLTVLHYRYYQVLIVLHSFILQSQILTYSDEDLERILSSIAFCVGAARATISLLDFHEDSHPFSIDLLNDISWSLDMVFINTLQHKGDVSAQADLALLGKVVSIFKRRDPNYKNSTSYRMAYIFYQVAWKALQNYAFSPIPPPNKLFPPSDVPLSKGWSRSVDSTAVADTSAPGSQSYESSQIPLCEQATPQWSTHSLHHAYGGIPDPDIADRFPRLGLDDDTMSTNHGMAWTAHDQRVMNNGWRLSLGPNPQQWEDLWTIAAISEEEEYQS